MLIPNNEGKVCDAIVRILEDRTGKERADLRRPEVDGVGPPVDLRLWLGDQEFALEHTLIESFEGQIETGSVFSRITEHIRRGLSGRLPGPACYVLQVPVNVALPRSVSRRNRALDGLLDWIRESAQSMDRTNPQQTQRWRNPSRFDDRIREIPPGFACEMTLQRQPEAALVGREPGDLFAMLICPDELEKLRADRLKRAYSDKCPKLGSAKAEGARTVLVLENEDIALASFDLIGDLVPTLLSERIIPPDEIYLAETHTNPWLIWLMKYDAQHWPATGVSDLSQHMHDTVESPKAGMPEWYRGASLPTADVAEWKPTSFDEAGLDDLSNRRG